MVDKWRTPWCYFCRHPPLPSPHQNNFRCRGNPICNKRVAAGVGSNFHSKVFDPRPEVTPNPTQSIGMEWNRLAGTGVASLCVCPMSFFLLDSWEFVWPDKRSHPVPKAHFFKTLFKWPFFWRTLKKCINICRDKTWQSNLWEFLNLPSN